VKFWKTPPLSKAHNLNTHLSSMNFSMIVINIIVGMSKHHTLIVMLTSQKISSFNFFLPFFKNFKKTHDSQPKSSTRNKSRWKDGKTQPKNHPWPKNIKENIHWLNATFISKTICYHFWHGLMVREDIGHIFWHILNKKNLPHLTPEREKNWAIMSACRAFPWAKWNISFQNYSSPFLA
jgi:hypothetical protein